MNDKAWELKHHALPKIPNLKCKQINMSDIPTEKKTPCYTTWQEENFPQAETEWNLGPDSI